MPLDPVLVVFIAALITAIATGLGAVPFAFVPNMSRRWLGASNAFAAGLMIAASLSLIVEGAAIGPWRVALGVAIGFVLIRLSHRLINDKQHLQVGALQGADARKALLIVGVMTLHSFAEGIGVGVAFGGGDDLGVFISAAIAIHNVPEGLAISLVLVPRGVSWLKAAWWSIFLQPAAAPDGGAGLSLRSLVRACPADRLRARGRGDAVDDRVRTDSRGPRRPARPQHCSDSRGRYRADDRLSGVGAALSRHLAVQHATLYQGRDCTRDEGTDTWRPRASSRRS
jgi:hypothetical protein